MFLFLQPGQRKIGRYYFVSIAPEGWNKLPQTPGHKTFSRVFGNFSEDLFLQTSSPPCQVNNHALMLLPLMNHSFEYGISLKHISTLDDVSHHFRLCNTSSLYYYRNNA